MRISKKENISKRNVLVIYSNQKKLPALAQADESWLFPFVTPDFCFLLYGELMPRKIETIIFTQISMRWMYANDASNVGRAQTIDFSEKNNKTRTITREAVK